MIHRYDPRIISVALTSFPVLSTADCNIPNRPTSDLMYT